MLSGLIFVLLLTDKVVVDVLCYFGNLQLIVGVFTVRFGSILSVKVIRTTR